MRKNLSILPLILLLSSCSLFGTNPSAPTATEGKFFNIVTNYVTAVVTQTNTVTLTNNVIQFQTNQVGQLILVTNQVLVPTAQIVFVTNTTAAYTMTPNSTTTGAIGGISTATNLVAPGFGGLVGAGLTALVGLWGYLRSYKPAVATNDALTQEMETVGEFIKALPNGATYWKSLTDFLAAHQADAGVVTQVATLLSTEVSNKDAQAAAFQVIASIKAIQSATLVPTPAAVPDPVIAAATVKFTPTVPAKVG